VRLLVLALVIALVAMAIPMTYKAVRFVVRARRDRKDLAAHRDFVSRLNRRALKHQELDDHFAVIIADEIRQFTGNNQLPEGTN
jgi:hypothetical protein